VEEVSALFHGFAVVLTPFNLMLMLIGITLGVIIGVLPGLGGRERRSHPAAAHVYHVAHLGDHHALVHLLGRAVRRGDHLHTLQYSRRTVVGGHHVRRATRWRSRGSAGEALTGAFTSSFVGALVAVIMFTFLAPLVAKFALQFGPPEFFSVYLLTFCSFVGTGKGNPFKIIASMMLGFAMAAVGIDIVTGQLRLTFELEVMLSGFHFLVAVIGLFGIGEILLSMEEGLSFSGQTARINTRIVIETWKKLPRYWATSIRSCVIGCWMGIIPGGATPAFVHELWRGAPDVRHGETSSAPASWRGVVGAGNRRSRGRHLGPAADDHAGYTRLADGRGPAGRAADLGPAARAAPVRGAEDFVWGLIASMYLGNIAGLIVVLTAVPLFAAILRVPFPIIAPVIVGDLRDRRLSPSRTTCSTSG
jgi:putative tricarboxylic transport membrane protein